MKVITSHERTDLDALASIYGAALLYPDHHALLPRNLNRNLRDFLALYRDELPFKELKELPREQVTDLILVDTQGIAPIRGMKKDTRIHIIDHHTQETPESDHVLIESEPVGATTSILVERMEAGGIVPDRLGATLLLMGIYEDTGALSYMTTTARDAAAVAWLLGRGADLGLANDFLHHPLSNGQREVLDKLISQSAIHSVQGRGVCVATVTLEHHVDELSSLVHLISDVYEPDACFLLAQHEESIQMIGRSSTDAIDVAQSLREFGGGGHSKAAAALVEGEGLQQMVEKLLTVLARHTAPPILVREIMSTNVHTLDEGMSIQSAAGLMRRYGHEGFPVVEGGRLIGILTRSDVDRTLHHQLGDMPVRNILHTGPLHVSPIDSVDEVQRVMIEHGLGQVPVVDDEERFVGIVTRTDLIKLWAPQSQSSRAQELRHDMEQALPDGLAELLLSARDVANELGYSLYIVGGFVRDLLLGSPTLDLDLVVEGDAIRMAEILANQIGGRLRSHARFGTAKVILEDPRPSGVPAYLDFVTARTEFYERPSVLPQVERSSIRQDLYRRDFTINTMAICLDRDRYGELLDYYGGERDLEARKIRVLHNLSFLEDPTRILRAVRFETRLGFGIEERTAELIDDALDALDDVSGERLRNELYSALNEKRPEAILERLSRMGVLSHLYHGLRFSGETGPLFVRLRDRFHAWPADSLPPDDVENQVDDEETSASGLSLCYLALLTAGMPAQELESFALRLRIANNDVRFLQEVIRLSSLLTALNAEVMLRSYIYALLSPFSREARFVLSVLTDSRLVLERLDLYEGELSGVAPRIDGHYLQALGVPPGPVYREILGRIHDSLLDGQVETLEEEQALATRLVEVSHRGT